MPYLLNVCRLHVVIKAKFDEVDKVYEVFIVVTVLKVVAKQNWANVL